MDKMTVAALRTMIRERLAAAGIAEAETESWIWLEEFLGIDRAAYYADPSALVEEERVRRLRDKLSEREQRVPLQYLLGTCEFMGLPFSVDERVLIPRQDTECLVELALDLVREEAGTKETGWTPRILDLCTGSGCIGISLGKMVPQASVTLSDLSGEALAVADRNARDLQVRVDLVQSDLFDRISGSFDFIVSNPPYIPSAVLADLMPEVRDYEPRTALDGEEDGLTFYRRIVHEAGAYLKPGGWLLLEIGMDQGKDLVRLLEEEGFFNIEIKKDLAGLDRIAVGKAGTMIP